MHKCHIIEQIGRHLETMSKKRLCVILEDVEDVVYVHKAWTKVAQGATRLAELPPLFS